MRSGAVHPAPRGSTCAAVDGPVPRRMGSRSRSSGGAPASERANPLLKPDDGPPGRPRCERKRRNRSLPDWLTAHPSIAKGHRIPHRAVVLRRVEAQLTRDTARGTAPGGVVSGHFVRPIRDCGGSRPATEGGHPTPRLARPERRGVPPAPPRNLPTEHRGRLGSSDDSPAHTSARGTGRWHSRPTRVGSSEHEPERTRFAGHPEDYVAFQVHTGSPSRGGPGGTSGGFDRDGSSRSSLDAGEAPPAHGEPRRPAGFQAAHLARG